MSNIIEAWLNLESKGANSFVWLAYSKTPTGLNQAGVTELYDAPTDETRYLAIAHNKQVAQRSNKASDYTFIKFATDCAINHIVFSEFEGGRNKKGVLESTTDGAKANYIGVSISVTDKKPTNPDDYTWVKLTTTEPAIKSKYTWVAYGNSDDDIKLSSDIGGHRFIYIAFNKDTENQTYNPSDYLVKLSIDNRSRVIAPMYHAPLNSSLRLYKGIGYSGDKIKNKEMLHFKRNSIAYHEPCFGEIKHEVNEAVLSGCSGQNGLLIHGDDKRVAKIAKIISGGKEYQSISDATSWYHGSGIITATVTLDKADIDANKANDICVSFRISTGFSHKVDEIGISFIGNNKLNAEFSFSVKDPQSLTNKNVSFIKTEVIKENDIIVAVDSASLRVKAKIPKEINFTGEIIIKLPKQEIFFTQVETSKGMHLLGGELGEEVKQTIVKIPTIKNLPDTNGKPFYMAFDLYFLVEPPEETAINILTMVPKKSAKGVEPVYLNLVSESKNPSGKLSLELGYPSSNGSSNKIRQYIEDEFITYKRKEIVVAFDGYNWAGISNGGSMQGASDIKLNVNDYDHIKLGDFSTQSYSFCISDIKIYHDKHRRSFS